MRAVCLDGFYNPCIFVSPYYYYKRGRFLRQAFFNMCLPLGAGLENVKDIQSNKYEYLQKMMFFKGYIKICETAAPIRN